MNKPKDITAAVIVTGILIVLAVLVLPKSCYSANLELAIGQSAYKLQEDGVWYQSAYRHNESLHPWSGWVGLSGDFTNRFGWRVSAVDLGKVSGDAQFTTDDCASRHLAGPMGYGNGSGHVYGITLAPTVRHTVGNLTLELEAGLFAYHAYWTERWVDPETQVARSGYPEWHQDHVTNVVGLMARYDHVFAQVRSYRNVSVPGASLYGKDATQTTLGYQWSF